MAVVRYLAIPLGVCLAYLPSRDISPPFFQRKTSHSWVSIAAKLERPSMLLGLPGQEIDDHEAADDIGAVFARETSGIAGRRRALVLSGAAAAAAAGAATRAGAPAIPVVHSRQRESFSIVANDDSIDAVHSNTSGASRVVRIGSDRGDLLESASAYKVQTGSTTTSLIVERKTGKIRKGPYVKKITNEALLGDLRSKRAVFLGEHHPESRDHRLQAALIRSLHDGIHGNNDSGLPAAVTTLAVGLEAVQKQFQPVLDEYCAGTIDEEELQKATEWESRWYWSFEAYRPIFRTCRELGIGLLALDISTEDRSLVEAGGLQALDPKALAEYAPDPRGFSAFGNTLAYQTFVSYTLRPPYQLQQRTPLRKRAGSYNGNDAVRFSNFVARQMLRDEAMAAAAAGWLSQHPDGMLVACIGINHATFGCGAPGRLKRMLASPGAPSSGPARRHRQGKRDGRWHEMVASVLINPEPLNTGTELKICDAEGRPPVEEEGNGDKMSQIFVPNQGNQICIENSVELQNYALQLEYVRRSDDVLERRRAIEEASAILQARKGETALGLSDYLVFSPKSTTTITSAYSRVTAFY